MLTGRLLRRISKQIIENSLDQNEGFLNVEDNREYQF